MAKYFEGFCMDVLGIRRKGSICEFEANKIFCKSRGIVINQSGLRVQGCERAGQDLYLLREGGGLLVYSLTPPHRNLPSLTVLTVNTQSELQLFSPFYLSDSRNVEPGFWTWSMRLCIINCSIYLQLVNLYFSSKSKTKEKNEHFNLHHQILVSTFTEIILTEFLTERVKNERKIYEVMSDLNLKLTL